MGMTFFIAGARDSLEFGVVLDAFFLHIGLHLSQVAVVLPRIPLEEGKEAVPHRDCQSDPEERSRENVSARISRSSRGQQGVPSRRDAVRCSLPLDDDAQTLS